MSMGRAMCTAIGTVTWVHMQLLFLCIYFLKNKSGYEYGIEHARRTAPNTDIQPGMKERIHIRHKHKQGYREFISMHVQVTMGIGKKERKKDG